MPALCWTKKGRFNMIKFALTLSLSVFLTVLAGCSSMTSISPSTTPITEKDTYTKLKEASGTCYDYQIFFIPFFTNDPVGVARNNAIKDGGGNALIEVVVQQTSLYLFIYNAYWTTVQGTAVKVEHKGTIIE